MNAAQVHPSKVLSQLVVGNQVQQAVYVAARLGIADLLQDGPKSSAVLAQATGAHPQSLYRLLRTLAGFGIFAEDAQGCFELTALAELLRTGMPGSMRPFALWSGGVSYQVFGALEHSVMTGTPAFEHLFGMDFYEYLNRHPEASAIFDDLMARHTAPVGAMVAGYDLSGVNTIVDVGGGRGELIAAILKAHPAMRGILVDYPRAIEPAKDLLAVAGVADRCEIIAGDIAAAVPRGGDAYILKSLVHGMDDETATCLLQRCRQAMNDHGKLLLVEFVIPSGNDPFLGKLMDLLMLVGCYGRERTHAEFRVLLEAAGFWLANVLPIKNGYSVIEGRCTG